MSNRSLKFIKAIGFTLPWETGKDKDGSLRKDGGYTNSPTDPGGETKYGISKRYHPDLDIKNLTLDAAMDIYQKEYWNAYITFQPVSANLDNLPTALALAVFDAGVNCGTGRAIKWLGKALENKGPTKAVNDLRGAFYFNNNKSPNYRGWMNRLNDLKKYCDVIEQEEQNSYDVLEKILGRTIISDPPQK